MKIIVGLGNPGPQYKNNRHNTGFMIINRLADKLNVTSQKSKGQAIISEANYKGEKIILVKPLTFMNLSGQAVSYLVNWYKIDLKDLLIIYDDMDLPFGKLRLRKKGSAGTHNGMKSILQFLGSEEFPRLRIGIGKPPEFMDAASFVLGNFCNEEIQQLELTVDQCIEALEFFAAEGIEKALQYVNGLNKNEKQQSECKEENANLSDEK